MSPTLADLRARYTCLRAGFLATIDREFPGRGEWDWYRACEGTSDDDALAASETIRAAHDAYIKALHEFYRARDGECGVLGVDNLQKRG